MTPKQQSQFRHYERLIALGDTAGAVAYANKHALVDAPQKNGDLVDIAPATAQEVVSILPAEEMSDPVFITAPPPREVRATEPQPLRAPESVPIPSDPASGLLAWPDNTHGEIISQCLNPRLVRLRIADGRMTSMLNVGTRPWRIGANVRVKISERRGDDAVYETDWSVP